MQAEAGQQPSAMDTAGPSTSGADAASPAPAVNGTDAATPGTEDTAKKVKKEKKV